MSESLYQIAADLQQLMQMYEEAEEEGDSVALKAIDVALTEWCNHKEPAKVDSYAALIRRETAEADLCREEAERLMARVRAKEAHVKRLKDNALRVMQQFNIKELRTPTNSIKRVKNGGLEPLEITSEAKMLPEDCRTYTLVISGLAYAFIRALCADAPQCIAVLDGAVVQPNSEMIRAALREKETCPECKGEGSLECESTPHPLTGFSGREECSRCQGRGVIPRTIPGARLLPRGEHVTLR